MDYLRIRTWMGVNTEWTHDENTANFFTAIYLIYFERNAHTWCFQRYLKHLLVRENIFSAVHVNDIPQISYDCNLSAILKGS